VVVGGNGNKTQPTVKMNETKELYLESLNRAIQFIENNLDKKILLKDVASEAFLSEYHFHRIFNPHCVERPNLGLKKNIFAKFQTILG
jgi:AraC-like DNA-binding protein